MTRFGDTMLGLSLLINSSISTDVSNSLSLSRPLLILYALFYLWPDRFLLSFCPFFNWEESGESCLVASLCSCCVRLFDCSTSKISVFTLFIYLDIFYERKCKLQKGVGVVEDRIKHNRPLFCSCYWVCSLDCLTVYLPNFNFVSFFTCTL